MVRHQPARLYGADDHPRSRDQRVAVRRLDPHPQPQGKHRSLRHRAARPRADGGVTDPAALDPALFAWLAARSIARGVPLPVASHGGYRVDTRSDTETARWVFAHAGPGLESLA